MATLVDIEQNNQDYSEQKRDKKPGRPGKKHNEGANQSNWIPPCFRRDRGQTSRPRFPMFPAGFRLSGLCLLSGRQTPRADCRWRNGRSRLSMAGNCSAIRRESSLFSASSAPLGKAVVLAIDTSSRIIAPAFDTGYLYSIRLALTTGAAFLSSRSSERFHPPGAPGVIRQGNAVHNGRLFTHQFNVALIDRQTVEARAV